MKECNLLKLWALLVILKIGEVVTSTPSNLTMENQSRKSVLHTKERTEKISTTLIPFDTGGIFKSKIKRNYYSSAEGRSYKNPRNSPLDSCPRNEELVRIQERNCLRKCSNDEDCRSPRKKCLCDGVCGYSCIKPDKECKEPLAPENGLVHSNGRTYGDNAVYSCKDGYRFIGEEVRTCQAEGTWSGPEPVCQKHTQCSDPPLIPHARHDGPGDQHFYTIETELQYQCYPGYSTKGFVGARCLHFNGTARWFGPDINCQPVSCGSAPDILHGTHEGDCYTFSCRITYVCQPGYDLVGRSNRYCQADGSWTPTELPSCIPVQCPMPGSPENGRAIFTAVSYNSVVSYECKYGFQLMGNPTRRCGNDKMWIGEEPSCKEINCGPPGVLYNGWIDSTEGGFSLGASVIFRCFDGIELVGHKSSICQKDGIWLYPLPKCLASCIVPAIENGRAMNHSIGAVLRHSEVLNIDCNPGYEQIGLPPVCHNGTWTVVPRCIPARCKHFPPRPRNGIVIAPKTEHGMKALFKCKDGYVLEGINTTECRFGNWTKNKLEMQDKNGTWTTLVGPICREVFCPFPGYIENGKVLLVGYMGLYDYRPYVKKVSNNRQVMYECDKGYQLEDNGPAGATCVAGKWSPSTLPNCLPDQHPRTRITREIHEAQNRTKRQSRSGSFVPRKKLTTTTTTTIAPREYTFPSTIKYNYGKKDVNDTSIVNMSSKNRKKKKKKKSRVKKNKKDPCNPIRVASYTHLDIISPGIDAANPFSSGSVAKVSCSQGYVPNVNRTVKCSYGRWRPRTPKCIVKHCKIVAEVKVKRPERDISVYYNATEVIVVPHGQYLEMSCLQGYKIEGSKKIGCWLGDFDLLALPSCKEVNRSYRGFQVGADIVHRGILPLHGSKRKSCGAPTRTEGSIIFQNGEPIGEEERRFPDGTEVVFRCALGILGEKTTWKIICEDGFWVGKSYSCDAVGLNDGRSGDGDQPCNFEGSQKNVLTFLDDLEVKEGDIQFPAGTELVSRCIDIGKYSFHGSAKRKCVNGEWTGTQARCLGLSQEHDYAMDKPPTILIRHSVAPVMQSNDGNLVVYPGSIVHLECLWLRKFGQPKWEVSHNYRKYKGDWTTDVGRDPQIEFRLSIIHAQKDDSGIYTCITPTRHSHSINIIVKAVQCQSLMDLRRGLKVSTAANKMATKVNFTCANGNSLIGPSELTCLPSGNWSAKPPHCESIQCPKLSDDTDRVLKISVVSNEVGGRAYFSCPPGYNLKGPAEVACKDNGKWSHPGPKCEEVMCEPPEPPENGYIPTTGGYRAGDVLQFQCHRGFMMEGQPLITCQETGRWSGPTPKCVMACTYPGTTIGGTISSVKFYYSIGEVIYFDCAPGLKLQGATNGLRCLKNAKWSAAVPKCVST
ncbi:sushi, von Willebrand factor type A, EGF and pentraxin domain-containing protein 1-like isoform X3 [Artemia franciscana]|uniref:sushi, von Willebrand factor type A, EGF and pentraxin domain-containing protein 1-like isoform X3 n=1 Tax=Artemia franciscana TaxID=6661 RepID=UPI0032DA4087